MQHIPHLVHDFIYFTSILFNKLWILYNRGEEIKTKNLLGLLLIN
jgi:hypothetical protein